jgi:hypothetical protein
MSELLANDSPPAGAGGVEQSIEVPPSGTVLALDPTYSGEELLNRVQGIIITHTYLTEDASMLLAYWVISTLFQGVLAVAPCVVITGPAREAGMVIKLLNSLCRDSFLMNGGGKLTKLRLGVVGTCLLWESSLTNKTAALMSWSTTQGIPFSHFGSKAIYVGEDLPRQRIAHSIHIQAAGVSNVERDVTIRSTSEIILSARARLQLYKESNRNAVNGRPAWIAPTLSPDAGAIFCAFCAGIGDSKRLREEIVRLLQPHDQHRDAERSGSHEGLVVAALLKLSQPEKTQLYVKEIAAEVNRVQESIGESVRLNPEKVGHSLKKVGLFTRRLSHAGNGLLMDQETKARLHHLAPSYHVDDLAKKD